MATIKYQAENDQLSMARASVEGYLVERNFKSYLFKSPKGVFLFLLLIISAVMIIAFYSIKPKSISTPNDNER